eukprot:5620536-Alexandrium_andersonii.AAC.1
MPPPRATDVRLQARPAELDPPPPPPAPERGQPPRGEQESGQPSWGWREPQGNWYHALWSRPTHWYQEDTRRGRSKSRNRTHSRTP